MKIIARLRNSFLGTILLSATVVNAQDIHFSEFYQSPLTVNPALAGSTGWIRAAMVYRSQDHAVTANPYSTIGASFDIKINSRKSSSKYRQAGENGFGLGVNIYNDREGDANLSTLQANLSLAYQIYLSKTSMLAAGFQGGVVQRSLNFSKLILGSQYDPSSPTLYNSSYSTEEPNYNSSLIRPDIGAGLVYNYKENENYSRGNDQRDLTFGASVFHINEPNYSFFGGSPEIDKLDPRFVIHASGLYGISGTNIAIAPGILFQKQGSDQEILVGTLFRYMLAEKAKYTSFTKGAAFSVGGYYRNDDAIIAAALLEFGSYGIGVSYDFNVSSLSQEVSGRGAFEISLRFLNPAPFLYTSSASFK